MVAELRIIFCGECNDEVHTTRLMWPLFRGRCKRLQNISLKGNYSSVYNDFNVTRVGII